MNEKRKKPNGEEEGVFIISIDDGYVEYAYRVKVGSDKSIDKVYRVICKGLGDRRRVGKKIRSHDTPEGCLGIW